MVSMTSTHCSCCSCVQHESDPPSLSHFRNITPEEANTIANIDLDVLNTHNAIVKLHAILAARKRQRNTFVPAVKLPPEVLATVFEFACCPDKDIWAANMRLPSQMDRYGNECPVNAGAVTPIFIGAICSAWRSIAWGAPQLWNSITLLYNDDDAEPLAEMLDYWLSKSGELPLSVTLVEDSESCPTSVKVINVIATYAHRLHTVDLFLPGIWRPALLRIASCAPLLTRLTLRASGNEHQGNPSIVLAYSFAHASQLREVTLFGYCAADFVLPWAQLESLESEYDDIFDVIETFNLCPRLRRFSGDIGDMSWGVPPSVIMRHTALQALEISGFYKDLQPGFFKMLELPATLLHAAYEHKAA
ncbi:hypothetical protein BJ912DRAFT_95749 [Pholiota molesta]|nr:hypothetical protein BJ912DRAFT_95749 [Pholiota molesta]